MNSSLNRALEWLRAGRCPLCGGERDQSDSVHCSACMTPEGLQAAVDRVPDRHVREFLTAVGRTSGVLPMNHRTTETDLLNQIEDILDHPPAMPPVVRVKMTENAWKATAIIQLVNEFFNGRSLRQKCESLQEEVARLQEMVPIGGWPPDPD